MKSSKTTLAATTVSTVIGAASLISTGPAQAQLCGFYVPGNTAYYRHCGSGDVWIHVDHWDNQHEERRCVRPGETALGPSYIVSYAYYDGASC